MSDTTRNLIDHATRELFTNGANEVARRLVHHSKDGKDRGGWCETAVRDVLIRTLGKRIEELETLLLALCNRCGQQCEIIAANAVRKDVSK